MKKDENILYVGVKIYFSLLDIKQLV